MREQLGIDICHVVRPLMPVTDSLLVDPQPFILPVLRNLSVKEQDVATTMSGERELISGSTKLKEELDDEGFG